MAKEVKRDGVFLAWAAERLQRRWAGAGSGAGVQTSPHGVRPQITEQCFLQRGRENSACLGDCFTAMVIR